jgi:DNA-binding LytR/AlgR family response regulator
LIREPLSAFISQLAPEEFLRVHRSHVVRIAFIAEMRPMLHGDYELILRNGERLPLTRRYKQLLPEAIRERLQRAALKKCERNQHIAAAFRRRRAP